jgi:hypothetical protein
MNIPKIFKAVLGSIRGKETNKTKADKSAAVQKRTMKNNAMRGNGRAYKFVFKGQCGAMTWKELAR